LLAWTLEKLVKGFEEMRGNRTALLAFAWFIGFERKGDYLGVLVLEYEIIITFPTAHLFWGESELMMLIKLVIELSYPQQILSSANR
jgi:hypothetical protein